MSAGLTDHAVTNVSPRISSSRKTSAFTAMIDAVTTANRAGRRETSLSGITPMSTSYLADASCLPFSPPNRRLLGPCAVLIPLGEGARGVLQRRPVTRRFVARDPRPVERLRRGIGLGELLEHVSEPLLRIRPLLLLEGHMREAEPQLREEVVRGKKPLHAVALDAGGIQLENRRSPWRAVALAVALEVLRVLFHV